MTVLRGCTWDHPRGFAPLAALAEMGPVEMGPVQTGLAEMGPAEMGPVEMGSACETIRVEWSARSLQAFADFPLEVLVDQYDLIVVDHPHIPLAADAGLLAPLDAYLTPDVIAELACHSVGQSHASYAHHGHQYALAIDAAAQVSLYRPDLCPNLPRTWDEVLDMARDGTVLWPLKPIDAMSSFLTLSAAHEAPICVSRDQFISREAGLVVLAQMHELAMLVDKACLEENPIETAERLATSDRWRYCPLAFGYVNYSRPGFREHRLAYRDIPALSVASRPFGSCLGGAGIAVSSRSAEISSAAIYASWLASADIQRGTYYWSGGQPASSAAWDDETLDGDALGFFRGTRATLEQAVVRPRLVRWPDLQDRLGELVHDALTGVITDDACLDALDAAIGSCS